MSTDYSQIINDLRAALEEVPDRHKGLALEFERLVKEQQFRAAYEPLHKLTHLGDWSPRSKLRALVEKYMVVF